MVEYISKRTVPHKHRTKSLPNGRASDEEYELIVNAWREYDISWVDFLLLAIKEVKKSSVPKRKKHKAKGDRHV